MSVSSRSTPSDRFTPVRLAPSAQSTWRPGFLVAVVLGVLLLVALCGCTWVKNLPQPQPVPTPVPTPTPEPPPAPAPPAPSEGLPPVLQPCGAVTPVSAKYINSKCLQYDRSSKLCMQADSTPRVRDQAYCSTITGIPSSTDCKANPEGPRRNLQCDFDFLGQHCPSWYYSLDSGKSWYRCLPAGNDFTCDHFDRWDERQPYTGFCDVDSVGSPITGFTVTFHGKGLARACEASGMICSPPLAVDH